MWCTLIYNYVSGGRLPLYNYESRQLTLWVTLPVCPSDLPLYNFVSGYAYPYTIKDIKRKPSGEGGWESEKTTKL